MLSKASKLESEFSCEAAAIADWASERSIVPKLNSNIRDFLNCFFQIPRVPQLRWRVVNGATDASCLGQYHKHPRDILHMH